ncbi:xanthine dehydrogenase small subunit [Vibrio rhizosphaerae]|uniref:xanthine dehydrogenase small subunit n=1 Tax=Vibrio rhizosphaerae TaxID=398736 RepID=UPI000A046E7A|nr:xanthine dehydrogenase small subunit [Vibrio rhizosphaerae]
MLEMMINNQTVRISSVSADMMLLTYLRELRGLKGTKEGCASGDCGACTVVMVDQDEHHALRYRQINACITPLHAVHGKQIMTVEFLKQDEQLHPVQQAIINRHGSQCGFCTPGFVMSLYALSKQIIRPKNPADFLAGNLCRCTGYGPLIEAAHDIVQTNPPDPLDAHQQTVRHWLTQVPPLQSEHYFMPETRQQLAQLRQTYPTAKLIAGGTDLSLEVTQRYQPLPRLIDVSKVDDLLTITESSDGWRLGAAIPMYRIHQFMQQHFPSTDEIIERLGSITIRHRATLGGSLGHASPIGDIAPLLISLNGQIEVDNGKQRIRYAPEDYITGYRQTRLQDDEWISAIHLPKMTEPQRHAIYKVSKRYEDDIATVVLALNFTFDDQRHISHCIIAAGGVAEKSVRLTALEALFIGQPLTQSLIRHVQTQVPQVIHPLSDIRGSAQYRIHLVQNLLQRYFFEYQSIAVQQEQTETQYSPIKTRLTYHA